MSKDSVKAVTDAMEESTDWMNATLTFMTNLVAPEEEEEGIFHVDVNAMTWFHLHHLHYCSKVWNHCLQHI